MSCLWLQGDRRAGPSLQAFNFESPLGRQALKTMYQCIQEETVCPIEPPACRWDLVTGEPPALESRAIFFGQVSSGTVASSGHPLAYRWQ